MIVGKSSITAYFEQVGKPYFALFYRGQIDKGNAIIRNDKEEADYDLTEGKRRFENALEILQHGEYALVISDGKDVTKRGANRVEFKIPVNEGSAPALVPQVTGTGSIGAVSMEEVERKASQIAEDKFERLMAKKDLADAKEKLAAAEKELKEAQRSVTEPLNKLIGAIAPHSEHIISGIFGRPAPLAALTVSGIPPDSEGSGDPDAQAAAEEFITALAAAKPHDWKGILKRLTTLIKEHPAKFETALNFL